MVIPFREISCTGILVIASLKILNQFWRGNNSCMNDAILIKLDVHHHVLMIDILFQFHESPFIV